MAFLLLGTGEAPGHSRSRWCQGTVWGQYAGMRPANVLHHEMWLWCTHAWLWHHWHLRPHTTGTVCPALLALWALRCQHHRPHITATADPALLSPRPWHSTAAWLALLTPHCCHRGLWHSTAAWLEISSRGHSPAACPGCVSLCYPRCPQETWLPHGPQILGAPELQLFLTTPYSRHTSRQLHLWVCEDTLKPADSYEATWGSQFLNPNLLNVLLLQTPSLLIRVSLPLQPRLLQTWAPFPECK